MLRFAPSCPVDFNAYGNKDGLFFPDVVTDEHGRHSFALIHRPTYLMAQADGTVLPIIPPGVTERRQSLWMSHLSVEHAMADPEALTWIEDTHLLAVPEQPWENIKIGGGTPPVLTRHGWLMVYHGVSGHLLEGAHVQEGLSYSAGVLVLDATNARRILYRSALPLLTPERPEEREGVVPNVVFPTGIDQRPEADDPEGCDIYYGMADMRIGVARLHIPALLRPARSGTLQS